MKNATSLTAALLTLAVSQVNALGCYNGGLRFSGIVPGFNIDDAITARIEYFCSAQRDRTGGVRTFYNWCSGIYTDHIDFEMKYVGASPAIPLAYEDCKAWFLRERGGCDTGSEQEYSRGSGKWWIRIDPNDGYCP